MRTIRRVSVRLNRTKWQTLCDLVRRYRAEKQQHLPHYHVDAHFAADDSERPYRDRLIREGYVNTHGLQARMWKLAQKDAYETVDKQWAALAEELKPLIARHKTWSDTAKHYAFWLIYMPQRLATLVSANAPVPTSFEVSKADQRMVRNYLRRVIRRKRGRRPVARIARSIALDPGMYTVFDDEQGHQFIKLMSQTPRVRIVVPLTGNTPITGNVRVVLDFERQRIEVHYTAAVRVRAPLIGEPIGLDAGVSEVFTDDRGHHYGEHFGKVIAEASDRVCDKERKRAKLHHIADQAAAKDDHAKAQRLRRFNLGYQKMDRARRHTQTEMARQVSGATRQALRHRKPSIMAMEDLDIRGKAPSKRLSRRVSQWARHTLKERTKFLASAGCSCRKQVHPAYSSQTCPRCGFVHQGNRRGDQFQCLFCGHIDDADRVAAINLKARLFDSEIRLWTPKARVKEILLARFNARLEQWEFDFRPEQANFATLRESGLNINSCVVPPTVSGWTPGARGERSHRRPENETTDAILPLARENVSAKCDHV